jgi:hypothetical protein
MLSIVGYPSVVDFGLSVFREIFSRPQLGHFGRYVTGLIACTNRTVQRINDVFLGHPDQSALNHFLAKFSFVVIMPITFIFIAFPDIVINLLFGSRYLAGTTALQILASAAIIYAPYMIFAEITRGTGKPILLTKTVAIMACFNLVGNLALIPPTALRAQQWQLL